MTSSQTDEFDCPFCDRIFDNIDDLEYHCGMIHDASIFEDYTNV